MKAAILRGKGKLVVEEVPTPRPGPGQVLVRVSYCGICGSDLHLFADDRTPTGVIMGHEWSGVVAEVGDGVTSWKSGDRVCLGGVPGSMGMPAWTPQLLHDTETLVATHPAVRSGGFAEYVLAGARGLQATPDSVSDEVATLVDTLGVGLAAVSLSGMKPGDKVVIIGAGPIGLCVMLGARAGGAASICVLEKAEGRKKAALALGASKVLDPAEVDVQAEIYSLTGQRGADVVFECAGVPALIQQAVEMVKSFGRVALVGVTGEPAEIKPIVWFWKGVGVQAVPGGELRSTMKLLAEGKLDPAPLITGKVPLTGIQNAFESLLKPSQQIKVLVQP